VTRQILYGILMWGVCLYAFRRGGWEERWASVGIIVATYMSLLVANPLGERFQHVEIAVAFVDCGLLVLLLYLSLQSSKYWPLWLTAMQGLTILSHFAPYVPHIVPQSYHGAIVIWIYPMLIVLALAIHEHHRGRSRYEH
jgi:hypothetical protein